jgi:hypothetical protein
MAKKSALQEAYDLAKNFTQSAVKGVSNAVSNFTKPVADTASRVYNNLQSDYTSYSKQAQQAVANTQKAATNFGQNLYKDFYKTQYNPNGMPRANSAAYHMERVPYYANQAAQIAMTPFGKAQEWIESPASKKPFGQDSVVPENIARIPVIGQIAQVRNFGENLVRGIGNSVVGQGMIAPARDLGKNIQSQVWDGRNLNYDELQSGPFKLGYQLYGQLSPEDAKQYGIKNGGVETLSNIGQMVEPIVDAWGGGALSNIFTKQFGKVAGKTFLKTIVKGGIDAVPPVVASAFFNTLANTRDAKSVQNQLLQAGINSAIAVPFGFLGGAGFSAFGFGLNKAGQSFVKKYGNEAYSFLANRELIHKVVTGQATPAEQALFDQLNKAGYSPADIARSQAGVEVTLTRQKQGPVWDFLRKIFPENFDVNTGEPTPDFTNAETTPLNSIPSATQTRPGAGFINMQQPAYRVSIKATRGKMFKQMSADAVKAADYAIDYIEQSKMNPGEIPLHMSEAEKTIREVAAEYLGKDVAKKEDIPTLVDALKERIAMDTDPNHIINNPKLGEVMGASDIKQAEKDLATIKAANTIAKQESPEYYQALDRISNLSQKYLGEEIPDTMHPRAMAGLLEERVNDSKMAIQNGDYRNPQASNLEGIINDANRKLDLTKEEAQNALKNIFNDDEIKFVTRGEGDIVTPDGQLATGRYFDSMLEVVEKNGQVSSKDLYHESFHAYVDKFANKDLFGQAMEEIIKEKGFDEQQANEWLAEGFADFMANRQTFSGKILQFFEYLVNEIKDLAGRAKQSMKLFEEIAAKKRPDANPFDDIVGDKATSNDVLNAEQYRKGILPEDETPKDLTEKVVEPVEPAPNISEMIQKVEQEATPVTAPKPQVAPQMPVERQAEVSIANAVAAHKEEGALLDAPPDMVDEIVDGLARTGDEEGAMQFYSEMSKDFKLPPWEDIKLRAMAGKENIPQHALQIGVQNDAPSEVQSEIINAFRKDQDVAKAVYDKYKTDYDLPPFEMMQRDYQEVAYIESNIINSVTKELQNELMGSHPNVAQYKDVILKAERVYNLSKGKGRDDISTITKKVPGLDEAVNAINELGGNIQTMEDLSVIARQLPKAGRIRVGKQLPLEAQSDPAMIAQELGNPDSQTRKAIRDYIQGINGDQMGVRFNEDGSVTDITKPEKSTGGKVKVRLSKEIPARQMVIPGTGVIPPRIMEKIMKQQMVQIRELRKRSGLNAREFKALSEKMIGKPTTLKATNYDQKKKMVELLQPKAREEMLTQMVEIKELFGEEKAKIIQEGIEKFRTSSPLEAQYNVVGMFANSAREIATLLQNSKEWPKLQNKKGAFEKLKAFLVPFVREPLAAQLAGVEQEFYAPAMSIFRVSRNFGDKFAHSLDKMFNDLSEEEGRAVLFTATGIKGQAFKKQFGRSATAKEVQYADYLKEIFDSHLNMVNTVRKMSGQKEIGKVENYIPFILDEAIKTIAEAADTADFTRTRLKTNKDFAAGLFTQDPKRIINVFIPSSEHYTRVNLYNALLKDRKAQLKTVSKTADMFGRLVEHYDVLNRRNPGSIAGKISKEGADEILGKILFPKKVKLSPELQESLRNTEFYFDPEVKAMVDKGEISVPRSWAQVPDVGSLAMKGIYATKLGFANTLFTFINLVAQPGLGNAFTSNRDLMYAYSKFVGTIMPGNKEKRALIEKIMHEGDVQRYATGAEELTGPRQDPLNEMADKVLEWTNKNITMSETVNRTTSLYQAISYLTRMRDKTGMTLSDEDIYKTAAGFAKYINLGSGRGHAPFNAREGFFKYMYMFQQFALQTIDITQRQVRMMIRDKETADFWKSIAMSEEVPAGKWAEFEKLPPEKKAKLYRMIVGMMGPIALIAGVTGSWSIAQRYIPFPFSMFTEDKLGSLPDFQGPLTGLFTDATAWVKDPSDENADKLKKNITNLFKITQLDRMQKAMEGYENGYIKDDKGRPKYYFSEDETERANQAKGVGLWGLSTLPQPEDKAALFDIREQATANNNERSKKVNEYIDEMQRLTQTEGEDAAANYLTTLIDSGEVDEKMLENMETQMNERENKVGSVERDLKSLPNEYRARFIKDKLDTIPTLEAKNAYLEQLFNQQILTEDTMLELEKIQDEPAKQGFWDKLIGQVGAAGEPTTPPVAEGKKPGLGLALSKFKSRGQDELLSIYGGEVQGKMKRSQEYDDLIAAEKKYAGSAFGQKMFERSLTESGITKEQLAYDKKTRMEDDIQTEQVMYELEGLQGEELMNAMVAMRYVSEGSRKAMLTDTVINKLEDAGFLDETTADYLKRVEWDGKEKKFNVKPAKAKKLKKISISMPKTPKTTPIKLSQPKAIKPLKPLTQKSASSNRIPVGRSPQLSSKNYKPMPAPSIRLRKQSLGTLGG